MIFCCLDKIEELVHNQYGKSPTDIELKQIYVSFNGTEITTSDDEIITDSEDYVFIGHIVIGERRDDSSFLFEFDKEHKMTIELLHSAIEFDSPLFKKLNHGISSSSITFVGYKICTTS